jgi:diguanylate cyclase (GGDEF)-like protein
MVSADNEERALDAKHRSLFRQAVGGTVEILFNNERRSRLAQVQESVLKVLKAGGEALSKAFIDTSVNGFFMQIIVEELRKEIQGLVAKVTELEESNETNYRELMSSMKDGLTGLYLRKYFLSALKRTFMMLRRESFSVPVVVSLLFFDVDHFKAVNDTHDHDAGDKVLEKIGEVLRELFKRDTDISGRWGGEEFVIALPGCNETNAINLAEGLRSAIEKTDIEIGSNGDKKRIRVTISIGVITAQLHKLTEPDVLVPIKEMIGLADSSMYKAKKGGRNAVHASTVNFGQRSDEPALV